MTEYQEDIARWFQVNAGKLIWLTIVLAIVFVADRVISRVLRKILDNSQIPSASIFVNLTRVTIWVTGAAMVLQPRIRHQSRYTYHRPWCWRCGDLAGSEGYNRQHHRRLRPDAGSRVIKPAIW